MILMMPHCVIKARVFPAPHDRPESFLSDGFSDRRLVQRGPMVVPNCSMMITRVYSSRTRSAVSLRAAATTTSFVRLDRFRRDNETTKTTCRSSLFKLFYESILSFVLSGGGFFVQPCSEATSWSLSSRHSKNYIHLS